MIRIHPQDTDAQAKERQDLIVNRLKELGRDHVERLHATGGLPTQWNPIILDWLSSGK